MENNRMLLISMAGTRKTKHWPRMELTWAEFVEKLKTPVRSTETLEEYLSYSHWWSWIRCNGCNRWKGDVAGDKFSR